MESKKVFVILFTKDQSQINSWEETELFDFEILTDLNMEERIFLNEKPDFVLIDFSFVCAYGFSVITKIKKELSHSLVFVLSSEESSCLAVESIKNGADDFLVLPISKEFFLSKIKNQTNKKSNKIEPQIFKEFIGENQEIIKLKEIALKYSQSDLPILIIGESGTGKSFLAKLIHKYSKTSIGPFYEENMATIPEGIAEAVLFGTKKGVYTGAENREGLVEVAKNGTLFLDEISEASVGVQAKLLRVISEKTFRPLGATEDKKANIRLITASNADLEKALENKTFREDLYYRINPLTIKIPSLRERKDDIPLLIQYFVDKRGKEITFGAINLLKSQSWRGNVRELESTLERAFCLCSNNTVTKEDLIFY